MAKQNTYCWLRAFNEGKYVIFQMGVLGWSVSEDKDVRVRWSRGQGELPDIYRTWKLLFIADDQNKKQKKLNSGYCVQVQNEISCL